MSQSPYQCPITPLPAFIPQQYKGYIEQYQETFIIIGILGSLYGVLTVLSIISCYALFRSYMALRPSSKMQPTTAVFLQSLTILALFASTTIYIATLILNYHATLMQDLAYSGQVLWFSETTGRCWNTPWNILPQWISQAVWLQSCGSAATLTVNVTLGDAIVCWRACIVWNRNGVVKAICSAFIATTFVLGIMDTRRSCVVYDTIGLFNGGGIPRLSVPGTMFEGIPIGVATSVLSLSTNILATLLVAYKAWQSRRRLKGYMVAKIGASQVEKVLTLLIESGAIYSTIWTAVVVFQVGQYIYTLEGFVSFLEYEFLDTFGLIMSSALLPIIAIYPTIIILLVALNRSHIERGISQHLDSMPTPHLAITANTVATSLDETFSQRGSEVLVLGCEDGLENTESHTSQEWDT